MRYLFSMSLYSHSSLRVSPLNPVSSFFSPTNVSNILNLISLILGINFLSLYDLPKFKISHSYSPSSSRFVYLLLHGVCLPILYPTNPLPNLRLECLHHSSIPFLMVLCSSPNRTCLVFSHIKEEIVKVLAVVSENALRH